MLEISKCVYTLPRAVGHTWTELYGVKANPKAILVVASEQQKQHIDLPPKQMVTIDHILDGGLRGSLRPVVFDHFALVLLAAQAEAEIDRLTKQVANMKKWGT